MNVHCTLYQHNLIKMRASLNHCAVLFLSCSTMNGPNAIFITKRKNTAATFLSTFHFAMLQKIGDIKTKIRTILRNNLLKKAYTAKIILKLTENQRQTRSYCATNLIRKQNNINHVWLTIMNLIFLVIKNLI